MASKRSSRPRSQAAREELLEWVARGRIGPGSQLPPEPQLASKLGVSRATLRDALGSLEDEGLVTRTRGSGTFLAHRPRARNNLDANFGVSEAIRAAGMRPDTASDAEGTPTTTAGPVTVSNSKIVCS